MTEVAVGVQMDDQSLPVYVSEFPELGSAFKSINVDPRSYPSPNLRIMLEQWRALCRGRFAPARAEFDPTNAPFDVLPNIMLVDVRHDPLSFIYRLCGTGVVDLHGVDLTGYSVREIQPPAFAEMVWNQYAEVVEEKEPKLYLHMVPTKTLLLKPHAIMRLPYSSNGKDVDSVMSIDEYCGAKPDLKQVFEKASKLA